MRRISSHSTFFFKRVFPAIWFGFLGFFVITGAMPMLAKKEVHVEILVIPLVMAAFGYFVMKQLVFDLLDEVLDDGDALIVRNQGKEDRIALSNVINVSHSSFSNPPRITLTLREPCVFGREVTFSPPARFLPFSKHPLAHELIERVDAKRRNT